MSATGRGAVNRSTWAWLGEAWRELLDGGAKAVTLMEGDREVYGPMSLEPA